MNFKLDPTILSPEYVLNIVSQVISSAEKKSKPNDRLSKRTVTLLPVVVKELDDDCQPTGVSFEALSKNISVGGVGLLLNREINTRYIEIEFTSIEGCCPVIVEVRHQSQLGCFVNCGGRFHVDWEWSDDDNEVR